MKIKFLQFEGDFDKDDAKIVIPTALLILSLTFTSFNKEASILIGVFYYILYFFAGGWLAATKDMLIKIKFRCPKCKSRKILLQGYQGWHSDEQHAYYICTSCRTTSILTEGGLTCP